ncbi:MAG: hypothetical protein IKH90_00380 [Ruminococcus sp.]|nr:hypothetical protein [Ruminococcus sp.]
MPLVNAKCTNCGGTLTVDSTKDAAVCDFCGSPYIVEKAIQNYNYYITQNIKADNVNVTAKGEAEKERLLHNAETNVKFKEYNKAFDLYKQVSEDYPDDYRGWYGMSSTISNGFTKIVRDKSKCKELHDYMEKSLICCDQNDNPDIKGQWDEYLSFEKNTNDRFNELLSDSNNLSERISRLNKAFDETTQMNKSANADISNNSYIYLCILFFVSLPLPCYVTYKTLSDIFNDKESSTLGWVVEFGITIVLLLIPLLILITFIGKIISKKKSKSIRAKTDTELKAIQIELDQYIKQKKDIDSKIIEIKNEYYLYN